MIRMNLAECHAGSIAARSLAVMAKPCSGMVIGGAIGLVVLVLLTASFIFQLDWTQSWKTIGFPGVAIPPFFDLHAVTTTAAECARAGEPYPFADCGYRTGNYNYPPVWLMLGRAGITAADTMWLAVVIELPAIILLILLLRGRSTALGLVALPMVLSPSTILAFERANIDILEWGLVCTAALVYSERRRSGAIACAMLLCAGVVSKFIALFCTSLIVRFSRSTIAVSIAVAGFTALYLFSLTDVLPHIRRISPFTPYISYGYPVIFDRFEILYAPQLGLNLAGLSKSWVPHAAVAAIVALAAVLAVVGWRRGTTVLQVDAGRDGTAFLFGAGIYCGSFLLLGTNYAYRLIFLLLCLPQLFDWLALDRASRRVAWLLIGSCIISMWLKFHPEKTLHINQLTDWILFATMMMILALAALRSLWPEREAVV